jgi:hypothetical protein
VRDSWQEFWLGFAICGLAFFVRAGMWYLDGAALNQDIDAYLEIARNLAQGDGYSRGSPPHPTAYRPPLYPLLIAGLFRVGGIPWWLGGIQVLLGTLTVALMLRCGRLLNLGPARYLGAVFVALDPLLIRYTTLAMTEVLCSTLVAFWCWIVLEYPVRSRANDMTFAYLRSRYLIYGLMWGAGFGLICVCRPAFLAAAGLAAGWVLATTFFPRWNGDGSGGALQRVPNQVRLRGFEVQFAVLTGFLIVLAPWIIRNAIVLGKPIAATTHGGYTVLLANNPVFYQEVLNGPARAVWEEKSLLVWQQRLERDLSQDGISPSDEVARDLWMNRRARSNIITQPLQFLHACAYRCGCFWSLAPSSTVKNHGIVAWWTISLFYGLISVGIVLGLVRLTSAEWSRWGPLLLLPLTLWLTHLVYWTDTRMRAPVIPVLALVAARGFAPLRGDTKFVTPTQ